MELASRATYRGQVTKLVNNASEFLNSNDGKIRENMDNLDNVEEELTVFLDRLSAAHESLRIANAAVSASIRKEDFEREAESVADYADKAIATITRLQQRLNKVRQYQKQLTNNISANDPGNSSMTSSVNKVAAVKLQKLQPKKFSGDFKEWIPFWEQYKTLVHDNVTLSTVDKFNYLEVALTGKAANTLSGLTPTKVNYDTAIALLQEEYGNTEKIVDHTMQSLLSIQSVHSRVDVVALRGLYNSVLSSTRSLAALGIPSSNYYVMLKGVLLRCIPSDLRVDFHRYYDNLPTELKEPAEADVDENSSATTEFFSTKEVGERQVKYLLKFLKSEVESLEKANEAKQISSKNQTHQNSKHRPIKTAIGLFAAGINDSNNCFFCKASGHYATECKGSKSMLEKKRMLKEDGRCYRCLRKGHYSKVCKKRFNLVCKLCSGKHATSMCDPQYSKQKSTYGVPHATTHTTSTQSSTETETTTSPQQSLNLYAAHCESNRKPQRLGNVYLQTACAFVSKQNSSQSMYVRIVMDGGSQMSFIKSTIARKLNLPIIGSHTLRIIPFGSKEPNPGVLCNKVSLILRSQYNNNSVVLEMMEVPEICVDVLAAPDQSIDSIKDLLLADVRINNLEPEDGISVLIGADNYWLFATGEHKRITPNLTAVGTILGWTLQGCSPVTSDCVSTVNFARVISLNVCACEELTNFWQLETLGITNDKKVSPNLSACISKNGDRCEASLPWRDVGRKLHDNRVGSLYQMHALVRKLRTSGKLRDYEKAMQEMIESGVAERVDEHLSNEDRVYYMPHRPVYRDDKDTTKLRIVFNASAHACNHLSLNDHLEVGENLLTDILIVLLNFRCGKIGLTADIEKAFLQIVLRTPDRNSHRFFWFKSPFVANEARTDFSLQAYRMTRVTFGVASSPNLLGKAIQHILNEAEKLYPQTVEILRRSFYVDDLVASVDDEESARNVRDQAIEIMQSGSMHLRKWNSSNSSIRNELSSPPEAQKVLGLRWFVDVDELAVDLMALDILTKSGKLDGTKRNVLKVMSKVYDPFGLLGPWIVRMKILFQSIWRQKLDWDERLPQELNKIWTDSCADIGLLGQLTIPRYAHNGKVTTQIHVFVDASQFAFGAVAYFRTTDEHGNVYTRFLCAKNRVAPIKTDASDELTVPKLELTAALVGARLLKYLRTNLQISFDEEYLWTDSKIALYWILGTNKRWKPYVENRVREIRTLSKLTCWRHCPGSQNPADLVTRGINAFCLLNSSLWLSGPDWLQHSPKGWPSTDNSTVTIMTTMSLLVEAEGEKEEFVPSKELILDPAKFSDWKRLLRVTAYFFRAIGAFKKQRRTDLLTGEEINEAEKYWIHQVQRLHFGTEIAALNQNKDISLNSKLISLCPILDSKNEYLRVGGRLHLMASVIEAHPIIMPKSSHITKLIVADIHEKLFHGGVSAILSRLRASFWIIKGRRLIKEVIKSCSICKVLRAKPATQPFAPLPRDRIVFSLPFNVTGLDFAGPVYTYDNGQKRKAYVMLFTCASIRAIHLELTPDLTTESCIMGIRRFIARRGVPSVFWSDNAATFKKSSKELLQLSLTEEKFKGFLSNHRIRWRFIVERAPWWGGFWERLVGVVKSALRAAVGRATLTTDQLYTLLTEVENVVNSRPLTYIADDPLDLSPLTPAQLLRGPQTPARLDVSNDNVNQQPSGDLRQRWKQRLLFISCFKRRWYGEYLQQLRLFHHVKHTKSTDFAIGDVVLLEDRGMPKTLWHLGMIINIFPGRDGKIRSCEVRLSTGSVLRRPVQLLYPLEISERFTNRGPEDVEN